MTQSFGQRLATLRGERGWTQDELAEAAGLNRPRISLLENDEVEKPRASTIQKIAQALGVPVQSLDPLGAKLSTKRSGAVDLVQQDVVGESDSMETIGLRLKAFRESVQLSKKAFADEIKMDHGLYGRYEADTNKPSYETIQKIASSFPKLNLSWLLVGTGNMLHNTRVTPPSPATQ